MLTLRKFIIDASQPASDKIFDVSAFEKFLQDKIKVDGRVGNLGDIIQISQAGEGKIEVIAHTEFSGRYLKYLYVSLSSRQLPCNRNLKFDCDSGLWREVVS
jgi:large subunit ribosomal protein L22e